MNHDSLSLSHLPTTLPSIRVPQAHRPQTIAVNAIQSPRTHTHTAGQRKLHPSPPTTRPTIKHTRTCHHKIFTYMSPQNTHLHVTIKYTRTCHHQIHTYIHISHQNPTPNLPQVRLSTREGCNGGVENWDTSPWGKGGMLDCWCLRLRNQG